LKKFSVVKIVRDYITHLTSRVNERERHYAAPYPYKIVMIYKNVTYSLLEYTFNSVT
jgi:hypothetical protein